MDIFKNLLTKFVNRNQVLNSNLNEKRTVIKSLVEGNDFESSYLEFTTFNITQNDQKFSVKILFFHSNVVRNKKYLITDFICTQLKEGIDLTVISKALENRCDFNFVSKTDHENHQISIFVKAVYK